MKKLTITAAVASLTLLSGCAYTGTIMTVSQLAVGSAVQYKRQRDAKKAAEEREKAARPPVVSESEDPLEEYVSAPDSIVIR